MQIKNFKKIRIALVYDRVNKIGGAERVLLALHEIWPDAPLYTAVYNKKTASWADVFDVRPSFLQTIPFVRTHHEWFAWIMPMAFESFSFDTFDVVLSVTSAEAKNIITNPDTLHICYCLTPTRYLWSGFEDYKKNPRIGLPPWLAKIGLSAMFRRLRKLDSLASKRPDYFIAISNRVKERIETYYKRDVLSVIYPPVDVEYFEKKPEKVESEKKGYFLIVSRLVGYKRVDIVVDACTKLRLPLVVIGSGAELSQLKKRAGETVTFIERVNDEELREWLSGCEAFLFAGDEDFGISLVEAQAAGKPVIAYAQSGASEIVINGKTGVLFADQTVDCLVEALRTYTTSWYDRALCVENARKFSKTRFTTEMKKIVETLYNRRYV